MFASLWPETTFVGTPAENIVETASTQAPEETSSPNAAEEHDTSTPQGNTHSPTAGPSTGNLSENGTVRGLHVQEIVIDKG